MGLLDFLSGIPSAISSAFSPYDEKVYFQGTPSAQMTSPAPIKPSDVLNQHLAKNYISPIPNSLQGPAGQNVAPTPPPTPFPTQTTQVNPVGPQNIPSSYYTNRTAAIQPNVWDAIMNSGGTNYQQRLALALANQESSGGYSNSPADQNVGGSYGPYHIAPRFHPSMTQQSAQDPVAATQFLIKFLQNAAANGVPQSSSALGWNSRSGYVNNGPRYDADIPQMATTSTFYRGK